jgi:hypothetical protein
LAVANSGSNNVSILINNFCSSGCLIGGICYEDTELHPSVPCLICNNSFDSNDWSNNDGASCEDGLWCTGIDFCLGGTCSDPEFTGDLRCDDSVSCTDDSCDENMDSCGNVVNNSNCDDNVGCTDDTCDATNDCLNTANDGLCDDGAWCNGAETCDTTNDCQAGTDSCDPLTETCDEDADTCDLLGDDDTLDDAPSGDDSDDSDGGNCCG